MGDFLSRAIDRIDNTAAAPSDSAEQRLRKTLLIFLSAFAVLGVPWAGLHLRQMGLSLAADAALAYAGLSALALALLLITKRETAAMRAQLVLLLAAPFAVQWLAGGFAASGSAVLWALLSPLCALVFLGARRSLPWFAGYLALVLLACLRDLLPPAVAAAASDEDRALLFAENLLLVSCIVFIAMRYFIIEREKAQAALVEEHRLLLKEQERSESLLLNILPQPIAERLKAGSGTIADGFAEVTILFADIVGFTGLSAKVSPESLVRMLNEIFSGFDRLAGEQGVEKIKTIGDAYMVCAGIPLPRADHAEAIAEMGLGMCGVLDDYNKKFGTRLQMRIGVNSGPVVAGVIGLKKFIYDLWGDTVNTASRMESHGLPGRVQVTAATYERLKARYDFEERGALEVKGLGRMNVYLLIGRK